MPRHSYADRTPFVAGRKPFISALNMASTNDVKGYIDKLATFGTSLPLNRIVISPIRNGYGASVYALDNNDRLAPPRDAHEVGHSCGAKDVPVGPVDGAC